MARGIRMVGSLVITLLVIGVLLVGMNSPWANAAVSTNYQLVSQRTPSGTYTDTNWANIESPHSVSGDGRYVVFSSSATNLVTGDTNGVKDVFVSNTTTNTTTRVSVSTAGVQGDANSEYGSISYDGRYVVFHSTADNLVAGVTGTASSHVYVRDLIAGTTTLVDASAGGVISNGSALYPKVSADGRFVVFMGLGTNLVPGFGSSTIFQIYIKDMHDNAIKALSITSAGAVGDQDSYMPDISCGGNVVAFASMANNLGVPSGQSGRFDLMVAHLGWDKVELNDVTPSLDYGIMSTSLSPPQISCNGNVALFASSSTNAVSPSTPSGYVNSFQYNRLTGTTIQVSLGNGGTQADTFQRGKYLNASMSDDGRYVAFSSYAHNIDTTYASGTDTGSDSNVYIRDVKQATSELVTILPSGYRSGWTGGSTGVSLSADGSTVVFGHVTAGTSAPSRTLISGFTTGVSAQTTDTYKTTTGH